MTSLAPEQGAPPPEPPLPYRFGPLLEGGGHRYELSERLGGGNQASVWRGVDRLLSTPDKPTLVAVKLFPRPADPVAAEQAMDEARSLRHARHPRVVAVYDAGRTVEGWPFVVEELVDAVDLRTWREAHPEPLPVPTVLAMARDIGEALAAVHEASLVHCDIAPGNLLVGSDGHVMLTDFGCALEEGAASRASGTPAFMAGEQWRDGAVSQAGDVASLAGLLYWLLSAEFPYGSTLEAIEEAHARPREVAARRAAIAARCGVPRGLHAILERALDPTPDRRYGSAAELLEAIDAWQAHDAARRRRLLRAGALLVLALFVALGGWEAWRVFGAVSPPVERLLPADVARSLGGPEDEAMCVALEVHTGQLEPPTRPIASLGEVAAWLDTCEPRLPRLNPFEQFSIAIKAAAVKLETKEFEATERWLGVAAFSIRSVSAKLDASDRSIAEGLVRSLTAALLLDRSLAAHPDGSWRPSLPDAAFLGATLASADAAWPRRTGADDCAVRASFRRRAHEVERLLPARSDRSLR